MGLDHKQYPTMSLEQLVQFRRQQSVGQMLQESHHPGHSTNILTALYIYLFGLFLSSLCFSLEMFIFLYSKYSCKVQE